MCLYTYIGVTTCMTKLYEATAVIFRLYVLIRLHIKDADVVRDKYPPRK